jgi:hypothetical protein
MFLSPHSAQRNPQDVDYPGNPLPPGSIRLVRLLPGEWTTTIRCELFDGPLGSTKYRALSYVWGSKNVQRPIMPNNTVFPVTVNLEGALRHLRELHKADKEDFVLWIDALAINQRDVKERTSQVQMMGKIYAQSEEVVVYLGDRLGGDANLNTPPPIIKFDANGNTLEARTCDRSAAGLYDVFSWIGDFARSTPPKDFSTFGSYVSKKTASTATEATSRLFEAMRRFMYPPFTPWWSRIWVVQEITLNPKIVMVYGTITAPWAMLASAADTYNRYPEQLYSSFLSRIPRDLKIASVVYGTLMSSVSFRAQTQADGPATRPGSTPSGHCWTCCGSSGTAEPQIPETRYLRSLPWLDYQKRRLVYYQTTR